MMTIRTNSIGHLEQIYISNRPDMGTWWIIFRGHRSDLWVKQEYQEPKILPKWMVLG